MFSDASMCDIFYEDVRLIKWLQTEVALAVAQEELGISPKGTAENIRKASRLKHIDRADIKAKFDKVSFPILLFVG